MSFNLLDQPLRKLLEKFGKGNHVPGSGSAAALHGLIASKLIITVTTLSLDPKRKEKYGSKHSEFLKIQDEINNDIFPQLERLFERDSIEFDKVIQLRNERDAELSDKKRNQIESQELEQLRIATDILIDIAKLSVRLGRMSIYICDNGFKSAAGDSNVALNSSLAAIAGTLSIIHLNLGSFAYDQWARSIRLEARRLQSDYEEIAKSMLDRVGSLKNMANDKAILKSIRKMKITDKTTITEAEIEARASHLHRLVWDFRNNFEFDSPPKRKIDVLKPEIIFKKMKYSCSFKPSLEKQFVNDEHFEVAGMIDMARREVFISEQFPLQVRNFTFAHELAHLVLHDKSQMHRDRPIDGLAKAVYRDPEEFQADKFAVFFLMPKDILLEHFKEIFNVEALEINEEVVFALNRKSVSEFRNECSDLRGFSRIVASTIMYDGIVYNSLSESFGVSVESMAIRLEELKLVKFN